LHEYSYPCRALFKPRMTLLEFSEEELDRFGPYGSGLGAVGGGILFLVSAEYFPWSWLLIPVMAYVFCTCSHRKHILFSWAALAGAFGSLVGLLISAPIWGVLIMFVGLWAVALSAGPFVFLSSFLMSRYACARQRKNAAHALHTSFGQKR
jgi:hypothetical protein